VDRKNKFSLIAAILILSPAFAFAKLNPESLHNRIYRLDQGEINQCPDKVGIRVGEGGAELEVFPMEIEWEAVRSGVSPILSIKGFQSEWAPEQVGQKQENDRSVHYSAKVLADRIESLARTKLTDGLELESHATLSFEKNKFEIVRWSISGGSPMGEPLSCVYKEVSKRIKLAANTQLSVSR
jgi:hypothetical protein